MFKGDDQRIIIDNKNKSPHFTSHALPGVTIHRPLVKPMAMVWLRSAHNVALQQRMPTVLIAAFSSSDVYGLPTMASETMPLKVSRMSVVPWPDAITIGIDG